MNPAADSALLTMLRSIVEEQPIGRPEEPCHTDIFTRIYPAENNI